MALLPTLRAINLQRAMFFVDGTNLFHRLTGAKLKLKSLWWLCEHICQGRQIMRIYLYTTVPHFDNAKHAYGEAAFKNVRVVFGDAVSTGDGNIKEKGVDALLVADLVYHAAAKNYDYAVVVSTDTDFARALKRVEDFGCRTAVVSICANTPELLRESSDDLFEISKETLLDKKFAVHA